MLPNFLVVGAAKSGTTSLYNYLKQHPDIYMSPVKEPYFFSFINEQVVLKGPHDAKTQEGIISDLNEYKRLFSAVKNEKAIGECSNSYLYFYEKSSRNIKRFIPQCKIIIILRNPVERTFSHYTQHKMIGHENLSFRNALEKEKEREIAGWRWHYQYIGQSMYYNQVKWYMENFGKENVRVFLFEELKNGPLKLMEEIFNFLKVSNFNISNYDKAFNISGEPRIKILHNLLINKENNNIKNISKIFPKAYRRKVYDYIFKKNIGRIEMTKEDKQYLKVIFRDDIINLQSLINKNLSAWLS